MQGIDKRVVHNATVWETVVHPLETAATPATVSETAAVIVAFLATIASIAGTRQSSK
jgi:hypothetical protein